MKDTTVSFKIEKALKAKLVALAGAENRSLSNFIEAVLKQEIASREKKHSKARAGQ
jgi:predicted transcriptional regulator